MVDPGAHRIASHQASIAERSMLATLVELEGLGSARSSHYPGFRFWMMTLQFGVAQLRSGLEWSERALAMLADAEVVGAAD